MAWILLCTLMFSVFLIGDISKTEADAATSNNWCWPTSVYTLKSDRPNYSDGSYHGGTDFSVPLNSPIYSTCDGEVNMKDVTRLHQYINGWDVKIYVK